MAELHCECVELLWVPLQELVKDDSACITFCENVVAFEWLEVELTSHHPLTDRWALANER